MSASLPEALSKVRTQQNLLQVQDERAVELGVVIPLLRQLGWDTDNMYEIYPQKLLPGTVEVESRGKVDYALQTEGKCRVLMEVKRWSIDLGDQHEEQLASYCRRQEAGPNLAVLTNGRRWKFFLPPLSQGRPLYNPDIRAFLDIDIFTDPIVVESHFNRFLARENLVDHTISNTQEDARVLYEESENTLRAAGLSSKNPRSLNSFTFLEPGAKTTKSANTWYEVIQGLYDIMAVRHPERCREGILWLGQWFSACQSQEFPQYLEALGLYVKRVSDSEGQQVISDVLEWFGYMPGTYHVSMSG